MSGNKHTYNESITGYEHGHDSLRFAFKGSDFSTDYAFLQSHLNGRTEVYADAFMRGLTDAADELATRARDLRDGITPDDEEEV